MMLETVLTLSFGEGNQTRFAIGVTIDELEILRNVYAELKKLRK